MTTNVAILGINYISASIGLALSQHKDQISCIGNDRKIENANEAKKKGAIDKVVVNLASAVKNADVVLLALPITEIKDTLEFIAQDLKPGAVILDLSAAKNTVATWAKDSLPPERYFVSITLTCNPIYLREERTLENIHPDLFQDGIVAISSLPDTHSDAIKLASDLTTMLGAQPLFSDQFEIDGLLASVDILPKISAIALSHAITSQPGWLESRKLADAAYNNATAFCQDFDETPSLANTILYNEENSIRVIDNLINSLSTIREMIVNKDEKALSSLFETQTNEQLQWWGQRQKGNWDKSPNASTAIPNSRDMMAGLFGFRKKTKEK